MPAGCQCQFVKNAVGSRNRFGIIAPTTATTELTARGSGTCDSGTDNRGSGSRCGSAYAERVIDNPLRL